MHCTQWQEGKFVQFEDGGYINWLTQGYEDVWPGAPQNLRRHGVPVALLDQAGDLCGGQATQIHLVPDKNLENFW